MKNVVKYYENIDVSPNEYNFPQTVQKLIDKLFENDELLESLYGEVFDDLNIYEWSSTKTYKYNTVVWYLSKTELADKDCDCPLHILRCTRTKNNVNLDAYYPTVSFAKLGWKDLNPDADLLEEYSINKRLTNYFKNTFKTHADDASMHALGRISTSAGSSSYIGSKLADVECTNLDSTRQTFKFPYKTYRLDPDDDDAITYGICRVYDNGLMEYDITFRLGYVGYKEVDSEYGLSADSIECNTLDFSNDTSMDAYFNSTTDKDIFLKTGGSNSAIGDMVQTNRVDGVNVYSATLNFRTSHQIPKFKDGNYMIFSSSPMTQINDIHDSTLIESSNNIVFCKKEQESVTALLIVNPNSGKMYTTGYNAKNGGIDWNSFHCHIVGRYS